MDGSCNKLQKHRAKILEDLKKKTGMTCCLPIKKGLKIQSPPQTMFWQSLAWGIPYS